MHNEGYSTQFVCGCVCYLANGYTVNIWVQRYKLKSNAVLKVFVLWILLKILCLKVTVLFAHHDKFQRFRRPVDTSEIFLMTTEDYFDWCIR